MSEATLIAIPLLGAAVHAVIGLYAVRFRTVPAARSFAYAALIVAVWGMAYALEIAAPTLGAKVFWLKVRWPVFYGGIAWFVMALQLTGRDRLLKRWHIGLLCLIPTVTAALQINTEHTGLVRRDLHLATVGTLSVLAWEPGPAYYLYIGLTYLLLLATLAVLLSALARANYVLRRQVLLVASGTVAVLVTDPIVMAGYSPIPGFNFTWVALIAYGALSGLALLRFGMFSVVPIATRLIVQSMASPVFVLDTEHRVLFANQAALGIVGRSLHEVAGRTTTDVLAPWIETVRRFYDVESGGGDVALDIGGEQHWFDVGITPLTDQRGHRLGRLVVMHDVTELHRARTEAEAALARVRLLSGLLPMCASCKSVRDDQGYWQAVDQYLREHSDVEFTHGFCPDCAARITAESKAQIAAARQLDAADGSAASAGETGR